jgi:hypothetical protein
MLMPWLKNGRDWAVILYQQWIAKEDINFRDDRQDLHLSRKRE